MGASTAASVSGTTRACPSILLPHRDTPRSPTESSEILTTLLHALFTTGAWDGTGRAAVPPLRPARRQQTAIRVFQQLAAPMICVPEPVSTVLPSA